MSNGLPSMAIVGLADKALAESKERVRAALSSLGLALPAKRIAVNLLPADLLKEGAHFDLPIAMGLLAAMGVLPSDCLNEHILLGELDLDGSVRRVAGILPAALHAKASGRHLVCPAENGSEAAWGGGAQKAWPGEVSLAHTGVLFLDELAEFSRPALDSLRQPLETGDIVIARANHHVRYPARFQLIAAMNPCRCGYLSDPGRACSRAPRCAQDYMARISGPILDRFDILLDVAELRPADLLSDAHSESTAEVRSRILASREFAASRSGHSSNILNAHLEAKSLNKELSDNEEIRTLYTEALEKQALSARGFHKSIRVARTIADLAASPNITRHHVLEALSYRRFFLFGADNG